MEKPNHIDQPEFSTAELAEIIRIRREVEVEMRVDNPVRAKGLGKALQSALETAANAYLLIPRASRPQRTARNGRNAPRANTK
jgi:hypothetical protein